MASKIVARDFTALKGLKGISDAQVENHLTLYNGYVNRTNALFDTLGNMLNDNKIGPEYNELKRRLGWEHNGVILHELYFENLAPGGKGSGPEGALADVVSQQFGSIDKWKADFLGVAKMPGIGWAVAYWDPSRKAVTNYWIDRHDVGHPAGHPPLLVLDLWEHAFSVYLKPTERAKYLDDFFANVDWKKVAARLH